MLQKCLIIVCLMLFGTSSVSYGQEVLPLNSQELREVLSRLIELEAVRSTEEVQRLYIGQLEDLAIREKSVHENELDLQTQLTQIAKRERDVEESRADQLQDLIDIQRNKRSVWAWIGHGLCKGVTFGIARC